MRVNLQKFRRDTLGGLLLHLMLAIAGLVLIVVLYFYVYLPFATSPYESITVPDLAGKPIGELAAFLDKRNLRFEVSDSSYSADYAPLTVLRQYPSAGDKVKKDRKILVFINSVTPPTVAIPDIVDGSMVNAEALLRSYELKLGRIEIVPGQFPTVKEMRYKGRVLKAGDRIPKGSTVDLVVMDGHVLPDGKEDSLNINSQMPDDAASDI